MLKIKIINIDGENIPGSPFLPPSLPNMERLELFNLAPVWKK